ncbi:hypothetical protein P168DRAFT_297008 [Aspergillus campestris IBT 28561]|uniref:Galactose oxidase n=1 Tax=Aspergillus campestris (strain IBT 28561) TaxID=1392248 RepID=A0A2I1D2E8_ASPC2|nr:uncharacterized protein P168DRAFT_297008 [Aspergillus campestris IBT 28561]PKY04060.1 hypothetical protein P168DRAFT_297008 [Aspergillus campestris IBT 28561]
MDDQLPRSQSVRRTVGAYLASTLLLLVSPALAAIPYTPSHLLYSPQQDASFAYLLRSSGTGETTTTQFLSLNVSGELDASRPQYTTLLPEAPFRSRHRSSAIVPVIDQHGVVKVYTGDCHADLRQSTLWQFTADANSSIGNGTWEEFALEDETKTNLQGPNFLSTGFAYAFSSSSNSSVYSFAGMCPQLLGPGPTWVTAANYSRSMTVLSQTVSDRNTTYKASTTGDRAPPIAEAGFSVTPLQVSYSSTASGKLLQQQDFLLIGGHTQQAFLNMSQLAIFSLPQGSWSFVTVDSVRDKAKIELAVRETPAVEPRSGHTAVLSPDGSKVIVFGGWVGNTSVPAEPQLAILEIGAEYTGSGDWAWRLPSPKGTSLGLAPGTGVYGHGATMLPGGVMVIAGGYHISKLSKRIDSEPQRSSQVLLYNVTSNTWIPSYTNPDTLHHDRSTPKPTNTMSAATAAPTAPEPSSNSSSLRKVGLGTGLGIGIPAAAGLAIFLWLSYRKRHVRQSRDQELRQLALGAQRPHFWGRDETDIASSIRKPPTRGGDARNAYPWTRNDGFGGASNWRDHGEIAAERTGLLMDVPGPSRFPRLNPNMRMYRPPLYDMEHRRGDAVHDIHRIDEREEDETRSLQRMTTCESGYPHTEASFVTPRSTRRESEPASPSGSRDQEFVSHADGRSISPDRRNRVLPDLSISQPSSGRVSPEKPGSASAHSKAFSQDKRYSSDSYSTANTTLSQRQAEGEHLLREDDAEPTSPVGMFLKPLFIPKPRAAEWLGNVRRVLSATRKWPTSPETTEPEPITAGMASGVDRRSTVLGSPPKRSTADSRLPRRSVSASAELLRRKQGARDWSAGNSFSRDMTNLHPLPSTRDDFALAVDQEGDWDVEGAAEGRRVQVTFTVPKEKLRVVNATAGDMDDISEVNSRNRVR